MLRYLRVRKTMTMKLYFPFGIIASYLRETLKPFFDLSCISAVNTPLCNNSKTCWCIQQLFIITWNYYRLLVIKNMYTALCIKKKPPKKKATKKHPHPPPQKKPHDFFQLTSNVVFRHKLRYRVKKNIGIEFQLTKTQHLQNNVWFCKKGIDFLFHLASISLTSPSINQLQFLFCCINCKLQF